MATFTHVGSITKTDDGLTANKVPPELIDVVKSSFVTKFVKSSRIGSRSSKSTSPPPGGPSLASPKGPLPSPHVAISAASSASKRKPIPPKKRVKAKTTLLQIWESGHGLVKLSEAQSIIKAYDMNEDGKLNYYEAAPFIRDLIQVTGLTPQVMEYKPLIQEDESYVTAFVEIVFRELDANRDGELEPYDLFHDHGFANEIINILASSKSELNPSRFPLIAAGSSLKPPCVAGDSVSPSMSPTHSKMAEIQPTPGGEMRMIHQTMIDYEYEETMTNLLDPEEYKLAFAQKAYAFTPRKPDPKAQLDLQDYE
eukprot:TRINITY_DN7715_c0_g1_i1.p1 TRINITY_DN7715_c0_g1~~TRINITY_DN7715_c0_g1_i1.p1  ORF type:complete len:311 (+),score=96.76 TRINITY_DN7715_c0_g1_i1:253-1185(+)